MIWNLTGSAGNRIAYRIYMIKITHLDTKGVMISPFERRKQKLNDFLSVSFCTNNTQTPFLQTDAAGSKAIGHPIIQRI